MSHLPPKLFGCTAGVTWVDGLGLLHARTLDWPLKEMAKATRLFRFHRAGREFVVVGVPGMVGVLSGMLPGAYSVTINWAPPVGIPSFHFGPCFYLRRVLETCDTYEAAVEKLRRVHLATSVFFTVCGTARGQACVIERTARSAVVRPLVEAAVVQPTTTRLPGGLQKTTAVLPSSRVRIFWRIASCARQRSSRA